MRERLEIVGGFAQRMAAATDPVPGGADHRPAPAVQGAAYVITQLRVGKMPPAGRMNTWAAARPDRPGDDRGRRHGQGAAHHPGDLGDRRRYAQLAPGGMLVNFTNPAGLVTEALSRHAPDIPSVGVCNVRHHDTNGDLRWP